MNLSKITALYCRVSTELQTEGYSIDAQKELLRKYCEIKQIDNYCYYVDGGFSGSNTKRPMLTKLIEDCRIKKVACVIVYKLDRLSRSQKDTLYLIEEVFTPNGVSFISISENFETESPFGKAMIGILSVFAQLERETIKERTRMGMKERIKKGLWPGGGKTPYGYDYDKTKGTLVKNEHAEDVKKMYEMYLNGMSAMRIAAYFGIKYDRVVMQILKSRINSGYIEYKGKYYKGQHEPIIDDAVYEETARLIEKKSRNNIRGGENLLTGLIYCGKCGAKMRYQKWGERGHKICCYSQQGSQPYMVKDANCDNLKLWASDVEQAVINDIFKFSLDPTLIDGAKESSRVKDIAAYEKQLRELQVKIDNLIDFLAQDIAAEEVKNKLSLFTRQKEKILASLESAKEVQTQKKSFLQTITNIDVVWDLLTFSQKRGIIISLISKIVITGNKIDIYYTFG